jgi:hypothetical protein
VKLVATNLSYCTFSSVKTDASRRGLFCRYCTLAKNRRSARERANAVVRPGCDPAEPVSVLGVGVFGDCLALVDLTMSAQVRNNGEMASTTLDGASKWLLAGMAVHVSLERAWSGKALVADLALVLLLGVRGHLGRELAHH